MPKRRKRRAPQPPPGNRGGQLLKQWRDDEDITQLEAGFRLRVGPDQISIWEAFRRKPGRALGIRLRDIAHIPIEAWDEPAEDEEPEAEPERKRATG
jgi:transcriptional regulator with XRE-family HTH domain